MEAGAAKEPTKYTDEYIADMLQKLKVYVNDKKIPIVKEFAYLNDIRRQSLYEIANNNDDFDKVLKKCIDKKEAQLERMGLAGEINTTLAIFSLKQLGWKDKYETEINATINNPFGGLTEDELRKLSNNKGG